MHQYLPKYQSRALSELYTDNKARITALSAVDATGRFLPMYFIIKPSVDKDATDLTLVQVIKKLQKKTRPQRGRLIDEDPEVEFVSSRLQAFDGVGEAHSLIRLEHRLSGVARKFAGLITRWLLPGGFNPDSLRMKLRTLSNLLPGDKVVFALFGNQFHQEAILGRV